MRLTRRATLLAAVILAAPALAFIVTTHDLL